MQASQFETWIQKQEGQQHTFITGQPIWCSLNIKIKLEYEILFRGVFRLKPLCVVCRKPAHGVWQNFHRLVERDVPEHRKGHWDWEQSIKWF